MKILFKNNTKYTKEKYNDFIEFHKNKYGKKIIAKALLIAIAILYMLIFNIIYKNWVLILVIVAIAIFVYIANKLKYSRQQGRNKKMINNKKEFSFFFYQKYIKIKCGRKFDRLRYFELYKIFETKEYFFLYTDENHSLILDKEGFEIGNPKEFSDFMKKKCPLKYKKEK